LKDWQARVNKRQVDDRIIDIMTMRWNDELMKWQVDKRTSSWNVKLMKRQVDENMIKLQVDKMTSLTK
jgi:hypothetical protein